MANINILTGIELKPRNLSFPVLIMLSDEKILEAYQEGIKSYKEKARKTLGVLSYSNGVVKGSNPFAVVELGKSLRLVTPSELELAVSINSDFFKGTYEDIGLVLRSEGDSYKPNDYIAKDLAEQIKKRIGKIGANNPTRISLKGLSLKEDVNSEYGLSFVIGDDAEIIAVPEFAYTNDGRRFSRTDERGVPIFEDNGSRTFYAREQGVSRLFLRRSLGLSSGDEGLAYSNDSGRVVVVDDAEGVSQNFLDDYKTRLQSEREKQIAEVEQRYSQAMQVLKGEPK